MRYWTFLVVFEVIIPCVRERPTCGQIHVPARAVIVGIGSVPNSELFRGKLELSEVRNA